MSKTKDNISDKIDQIEMTRDEDIPLKNFENAMREINKNIETNLKKMGEIIDRQIEEKQELSDLLKDTINVLKV